MKQSKYNGNFEYELINMVVFIKFTFLHGAELAEIFSRFWHYIFAKEHDDLSELGLAIRGLL